MDSHHGPPAPFVVDGDADDARVAGGKAAALARLRRAGLPIPAWIAVRPEAMLDGLATTAAPREPGTASAAGPSAHPPPSSVSPRVRDEIRTSLPSIAGPGHLLAVRSSAVDEDGAQRSFAGQLESFLFVRHEDVSDRVVRVWQSAWHERVFAYRREHGLDGPPQPPAVLIQRMVDATAAGVAFGADPVTGRHDFAVVSAVPGVGTSLVSGESDADSWRVDADGRIVERHVGRKTIVHRADAGSLEGVARQTLDESETDRPTLDDDQIRAVAALARRCGEVLGRPQDIEWAIEGGRLWLLQSRPITTLGTPARTTGRTVVWDNSNIAESYSGVTTPLTFSFARHAYQAVYREFCRLMGVPPGRVAAHDLTFRRMLGLIRGRVYYNLESWYRTLSLLPGFTVNRRFMEQMMGVREGLPAAVLADLSRASRRERLADAWSLARSTAGLVRSHFRLPGMIARFYERLNDALGPGRAGLDRLTAEALSDHYRALERSLLSRWDAPLVNDFFAMIFHGVLRRLTERWCGEQAMALQSDLLRGEPGMISVEPARRLRAMAALAAPWPDLVRRLCEGAREEAERAVHARPDLQALYDAYLERFGDRCLEELKLESPTLQDDPLPLLRSIGQMARREADRGPRATEESEARIRREAEARVRAALGRRPIRRAVFFWVLRNARDRVRDRENLRFERTRLFGRVRRIFVELGRRFHEAGCLDDPRDIFWLEVDEALGFVDGTATTADLRGLVAVRKAEFARHRADPVPAGRFETRGIVHVGNRFEAGPDQQSAASGEVRQGLGCCAGVVRGRARVVRDPKGVQLLRDEILVAQRTDPGWVLLFPAAAGLVVEHGSLLSHSAIVARELGLPAVVSVAGATAWLADGDLVELDGATGIVRRLGAAESTPAPAPGERAQPRG